MSDLATFSDDARVAVFGASGGIGEQLVEALADSSRVSRVHALSRSGRQFDGDKVETHTVDITDEASIDEAFDAVTSGGELDLVLVATGILHEGDDVKPEKAMKELGREAMQQVMLVNAIGPALVARRFLPKMRRKGKSVFAAISARVGSISDNRLGGWASYRASKAALNMFLRTLSIEQARLRPECIVAALHPGTVDTPLSKPYTKRTPDEKIFAADEAAGYLLGVVDELKPEDNGGFFAWDGSRIEY